MALIVCNPRKIEINQRELQRQEPSRQPFLKRAETAFQKGKLTSFLVTAAGQELRSVKEAWDSLGARALTTPEGATSPSNFAMDAGPDSRTVAGVPRAVNGGKATMVVETLLPMPGYGPIKGSLDEYIKAKAALDSARNDQSKQEFNPRKAALLSLIPTSIATLAFGPFIGAALFGSLPLIGQMIIAFGVLEGAFIGLARVWRSIASSLKNWEVKSCAKKVSTLQIDIRTEFGNPAHRNTLASLLAKPEYADAINVFQGTQQHELLGTIHSNLVRDYLNPSKAKTGSDHYRMAVLLRDNRAELDAAKIDDITRVLRDYDPHLLLGQSFTGKLMPGNTFEIIDKIGAGGMGMVYKVKTSISGGDMIFAVKFPSFEILRELEQVEQGLRTGSLHANQDKLIYLEGILNRFQTEAEELKAYSENNEPDSHSINVPAVIDYGKMPAVPSRLGQKIIKMEGYCGDVPYYVCEWIDGKTLRDSGKIESTSLILRVIVPLAELLDDLHSRGIIHRDIKPENIMLKRTTSGQIERVVLLDFGVIKKIGTDRTAAGDILGSPPYQDTDYALTGETKPENDLFSLAMVAYEGVTDRLPYDPKDAVTRRPESLIGLAASKGPSEELISIINDAYWKNPINRISMREFIDRIKAWAGTGASRSAPIVEPIATARTVMSKASGRAAGRPAAAAAAPAPAEDIEKIGKDDARVFLTRVAQGQEDITSDNFEAVNQKVNRLGTKHKLFEEKRQAQLQLTSLEEVFVEEKGGS
jgi:serine/threonine protein kinase